jgi:glycine/D-amino acid oxidase-like deaminating enzyme
MSTAQPDILIVGAGIAGAATAYHLAQVSSLGVLIVEKEATAGAHSTGRNAALVREYMENPALQELAREGASFLRAGRLARFEACGAVLLGLGDRELGQWVSGGRGRGMWCPQDGIVDVAGLLQSYLAGQQVSYNTEVLGWRRAGRKLIVSTNCGEITCGVLVNAAGPWAGILGGLPLTPMNRHIFVSPPLPWVDPGWPFVWDVPNGYYFRPESGGLLLSPCDETPAEPGDYTEDPARLEELAEKLMSKQPGLGELAIQSSWVGQRTFAPDREFVIGFDPRDDRVFHVAALGGHGITVSYAAGRLAAMLLIDQASRRRNRFHPDRLF